MVNIFKKRIYEHYTLYKFNRSPVKALKSIHIQLNNFCNLNCKWCSFVNPPEKELIKKELLIKLFDEITTDKRFNIKEINLWSAGEPLLHIDFVGIMELIAKYKKKNANFPKVKIMTNVMLLNEEIAKKIIKIGAIDYIGFSVDGGSREGYERLRAGGKFDIMKRNIQYFVKINNGKIQTMVNCVVPLEKPLDTSWMSEEFREILESVDFYKLNYPDNNAGKILVEYPNGFKFNKTNRKVCLALIQGLVIIQNGNVLFCCNDFNGDYPFDNLYQNSLFEICNSRIRKDTVDNFLKGGKKSNRLCSNCNRFEVPFKIFKNEKIQTNQTIKGKVRLRETS